MHVDVRRYPSYCNTKSKSPKEKGVGLLPYQRQVKACKIYFVRAWTRVARSAPSPAPARNGDGDGDGVRAGVRAGAGVGLVLDLERDYSDH